MKDEVYMQRCLELAGRGLGNTYPNPLVGCVIVHNNIVIGEGYHHKAGEPHAEVNAINSVKNKTLLKDSTLYVNLEPCAHFGKTPPCANLVAEHNIRRVIIGNVDPHKKVAGKGIEILKTGGCDVEHGILDKESRHLNRRFFCFHQKKRPYIVLKWAQTMDGFIDRERQPDEENRPNWITSETARMLVHKWRTEEQSIMVGTKTALLDNPNLNVRHWHGQHPVRILLDKKGKVGDAHNLLDDQLSTYIFTEQPRESKRLTHFIQIKFNENTLQNVLQFLYEKNIQSVFVEGGAMLLNSFIHAGLWDEARVFTGQKEFKSGVKAPVIPTAFSHVKKINKDILVIYSNL